MLVNKKKLRKVVAVAACLAVTTTFTQAQTPVSIDISTLGGTAVNNSGNPTESQWWYGGTGGLYLNSSNGTYTLTGTNADVVIEVFGNNASVTLNSVSAKQLYTSVIDNLTVTLIGTNSFVTSISGSAGVYYGGNGNFTITSSSGGILTAKSVVYGIELDASTANLIIDGNADVTSEGRTRTSNNIQMSDYAKLTMKTSVGETHNFEKFNQSSTYEWKLTNVTTTNLLTDSIISVTVAAGETGTVERVNPIPVTYTITSTAGTGGSISPSGTISVEEGKDTTFTFLANSGYEISQVLIDNLNNFPAVAAGSYTFTNVMANHKIEVYFSPITGISEATAEKMTIYPNPTNGQLRVSGDIWDNCDREIIIFDVIGQVVFMSQLSKLSPETTIDISHLSAGLYVLKVDGKMFKVVKE